MDNTSHGGSLENISSHYDLGNDMYQLFLDNDLMMYSSAIYDTIYDPRTGIIEHRGTLEEAQYRKVDTLIAAARIEPHHKLLDIGFGWGGITIRAAQTIGCKVWGITLSKEQKAFAEAKVKKLGLEHLITYELIDYRIFAKVNKGQFDRIISCEMIEAVGHNHLGEYMGAVDELLAPGGIFVCEAITTPEARYEEYVKSTDFINSIVFPGSCCPSLSAVMEAMSKHSKLSLESYLNIDVHYAETLREWRRRFNKNLNFVRQQGFDDVFIRCWNYYFCYCEAAFETQTEGCLIITLSRPGNRNLLIKPAEVIVHTT
jgi:cyclopropane-fatty-acyl-phospholipid synthase